MEIKQITDIKDIENAVYSIKGEFKHLEDKVDLVEYCRKLYNFAYNVELVEDDKIIGFAAMYINDIENKRAFLSIIGIVTDYQRKGFGRLFIKHCIDVAIMHNMKILYLEVDNDNKNGILFYNKIGFHMKNITGRGSIVMSKLL